MTLPFLIARKEKPLESCKVITIFCFGKINIKTQHELTIPNTSFSAPLWAHKHTQNHTLTPVYTHTHNNRVQILQRTWSERRKTITCNMPLFSVWFLCRCVPCSSLSFLVHPLGLTPCYTSNLNMNLILIVLTLKWRHKEGDTILPSSDT